MANRAIWIVVVTLAYIVELSGAQSGQYLQLTYRIYDQGAWSADEHYLSCTEHKQQLSYQQVTFYIEQTAANHDTCLCEISKRPTAARTGIQLFGPTHADYHSSEWKGGEMSMLELRRVYGAHNKTQLRLQLEGHTLEQSLPINVNVYGDFLMECWSPASTTTVTTPMPTTMTTTTPTTPSSSSSSASPTTNVDTKSSYKTMQVFLAAILSLVAVALVTTAAVILCCCLFHRRKQSNLSMAYKAPPIQPYRPTSQSNIYTPRDFHDNNNEIAEVIYDNNITKKDQDNKSKRKSLSFRDTMYANFTAIMAAMGKTRLSSGGSGKHRELQNQFSVEPRTYVNYNAGGDDNNTSNDAVESVQYADIDVTKLAPVEFSVNVPESEQYQIAYADLDFRSQNSGPYGGDKAMPHGNPSVCS